MRFLLFDKVTDFVPGESATGVKNISSQEEFLIDHYDRRPLMPSPLIIESIAQLGGWAVTVSSAYRYLAVMVMIKDLEVSGDAEPGDQVALKVRLENMNEYGANISAEARVGDRTVLTIGSLTYGLYEIPEADKDEIREKYNKYQCLAGR